MQRLRSQAFDAFENADYTAAITFLDKILEVSFLNTTADKLTLLLTVRHIYAFDMLYTTKKPRQDKIEPILVFVLEQNFQLKFSVNDLNVLRNDSSYFCCFLCYFG
jgi:hypothetical protein